MLEDGRWSQWGEWSECSVTCGRGNRQRLRTCSRTMFGGKSCVGDNIQVSDDLCCKIQIMNDVY